MRPWVAVVAALFLIAWARASAADYLEIRRNAWLKKTPVSEGELIEKLEPDTLVSLESDQQQNGYYSVKTRAGTPGFVYRTLVRRHAGTLPPDPGGPTPPPGPTPVPGPGPPDPASFGAQGPEMRVHLIDVGQGAATLFEFSCGAILVDTGGETNGLFDSGNALRAYLDAFFAARADLNRTLAAVILTHPHRDHTENAQMVAETYTVENVVTDGITTGNHSGLPKQNWLRAHAAHLETVTALGVPKGGRTNAIIDPVSCADEDPKLEVLWGSLATQPADWNSGDFKNANNHSVVLRVDFGAASVLIAGDLEEKGIASLLEKHAGTSALDVDVWQVNHHGSSNGTTEPLLDAITPVIALLGTGSADRQIPWTAWQYGHPRKAVIDLIESQITRARPAKSVEVATGARAFEKETVDEAIYATGWDGGVVVRAFRDGGYDVGTER